MVCLLVYPLTSCNSSREDLQHHQTPLASQITNIKKFGVVETTVVAPSVQNNIEIALRSGGV